MQLPFGRLLKTEKGIGKMVNNVDVGYKYLPPTRIVVSKDCENEEFLLRDAPRQALQRRVEFATIKEGGYILFDFGKEIHGGINITTGCIKRLLKMHITFGESVSEALGTIGVKNSVNDHAMRDYEIELPYAAGNFETGCTGFRFVKIEAVGGEITVDGIYAKLVFRDMGYLGSFECDDAELNQIWKTGAYTVQLNMQEYIWDGIKRDRLVWIGDMHPEVSTALSVFGGVEVIKNSLDLVKESTPTGEWANGIRSYSLWWIVLQRDWYMATGDKEYIIANGEYISEHLKLICKSIYSEDENKFRRYFVDWSSNETEAMETGFTGVLMIALKAGEELCKILNDTKTARLAAETAETVRRVFVPCCADNKQVTALAALGELIDKKEAADFIKRDGAKGFSAFMGYYSLLALHKADEMSAALDIIKSYWGGMIKMGATSFWEDFDIDDMENAFGIDEMPVEGKRDVHGDCGKFCYEGLRKSLCHGWASGPTAFLSEKVLGVMPVEAGYRRVKINPDLGNLKWAKGTIPTPFGIISAEHHVENGKIVSKIDVPEGVSIER